MNRQKLLVLSTTAVVAALLIAVAIAGLVRVGPGEALVARTGDGVRVYESGRHWRLPGTGELLRIPREPLPWSGTVEARTPEGAVVALDVAGAFRVAPGTEAEWLRHGEGRPFLDGVNATLRTSTEGFLRRRGIEPLLDTAGHAALAQELASALAAAAVESTDLRVEVPVARNAALAAALERRWAALARPTGRKVLVVGWDGADWLMIRPLLVAGKLPNLHRLIERGASGELRSEEPLLSPLLWTTIATGKPVLEHGIADFLVKDAATGSYAPISSQSRKVHALWTILPAFGLRTDVVGWWATWPAEPTRGTIVSDRVAYQLFDLEATRDAASSAGKVYPPAAWERVQQHLVSAEQVPLAEVRRFVDLPEAELARRWDALPADRRQEDRVNHLRKILATTRSYHAIALDLLRSSQGQADLTLVYYEGTDTVGHLFAQFLPPRLGDVSEEEVRQLGGALPEFYAYADELLGELLDAAGPDTTTLLISDHGFFTGAARPASDPSDFKAGAPNWHRLYGILAAAGPGVERGAVAGASIFDIAPTVLAILGLPVAADLPGRMLPELVGRGDAAAADADDVVLASFEALPREQAPQVERSAALDEERLRELAALGYISGAALDGAASGDAKSPAAAVDPAAPSTPAESAEPAAAGESIVTEAYNLGRIHQQNGDWDAATAEFRRATELLPSFGTAWASLAQVQAQRGRHSQAFDLLVQGFAKSDSMPASAVTGLVDEAKQVDRLADAERTLQALRPAYRGLAAYGAALGSLREEQRRPAEALALYRQVLARDPLDQLSLDRAIGILRAQGAETEARAVLDDALRAGRGTVTHLNFLGVLCLRQRWADQAESIFREILASDPGNPGVLANLAAALAQQGRGEEAIARMREAVQRAPENGRYAFNLGAMLAEAGQAAEAFAAFRKAEQAGLKTPPVYVAIAKMAVRSGDLESARRALQHSLVVDPTHAESRELLRILEEGG